MGHVEREENTELDSSALEGFTPATEASGRTFWVPPAENDLPAEPAASGERTPAEGNRVLQELRMFHQHGRRPAGAADAEGIAPLPALLHPYRDLSRVRYEFPLLLNGVDATVTPLTAVMDDVVTAVAGTDDAAQQIRHGMLQLESIMRSLVENRDGDRLSLVWDRAAATLFETTQLPEEKAAALRESVARARKALAVDGDLVSCGPHTPQRILTACATAHWTKRCGPWREQLDTLIRQLENILVADFGHSEEATQPEHLRDTLGTTDEMDVQAMSSLLRSAPRGSGLPGERRARVQNAIATLRALQPVFIAAPRDGSKAPIRYDEVFEDCASARTEHTRRMQAMTAFFKCVRIARLEIQNQYRDTVHDPFFGQFGEHHLTAEEIALCPPVLVRIADDEADRGGGEIVDVLNATAGIKILLELRNLYDVEGDALRPDIAVGWPARFAGMAIGLNHAFVMQSSTSRAGATCERMLAGISQPGPALFAIGVPVRHDDRLSTYLAAAAATESRLLPAVVFDPSRGDTLAERIDLGDNPQNEVMWPTGRFSFRNSAGEETTADLAFTPADFVFGDPRLTGHFWSVPAASWHNAMLPLHEMLELPVNEAAGRIPYILTVDRDNRIARVVVSRAVLELSRRCREYWRGLREAGGIENSFAARALAAERDRLSAEKEREIEEIEKNYVAQLEQDVGELTREIVQRIAGQLMGAEGTPAIMPAPAAPAPPRKESAPPPEPRATPAAAPEEDEAIVIDDAYIDTPLCTSCNECTQLNGRIFVYNANKQAEIKDATAGPFSDIVRAAELCPVHIIHPGNPKGPAEPGVDEWIKRAQRYN